MFLDHGTSLGRFWEVLECFFFPETFFFRCVADYQLLFVWMDFAMLGILRELVMVLDRGRLWKSDSDFFISKKKLLRKSRSAIFDL